MAFRVIVAGGRDFNDYGLLKRKMDIILKNVTDKVVIVSGTASGGDKLGERYAIEKGYTIDPYPADWDNMEASPCVIGKNKNGRIFNKLAGHNRNVLLVSNADAAVFFWNGSSTGTKNCIELAKGKGLKTRIIKY